MLSGYFDKLLILPICLGQLLSLCITGTSSASSALWQQHHVNIPFTQNALLYFLLTVVYGLRHYTNTDSSECKSQPVDEYSNKPLCFSPQAQQEQEQEQQLRQQNITCLHTSNQTTADPSRLKERKASQSLSLVILFSFVDVQANVLAVFAFKNTSVLSALIISSWTLPCIMLLSAQLLKTRYQFVHYAGVSLCLMGLGFLIWGDTMSSITATMIGTNDDDSPTANHNWLGDLICLVSATLYAISNVTEEYLVHHYTTSDFLYRIGLAGMIQSSMLALYFEYHILASIDWTWDIVILVFLYVICLFSMYSLNPMIYRLCGATFVSMNLMTSNFYSLLIGLLFLNEKMPPLYPLAYVLVIVGATLYNITYAPVYKREILQNQTQECQPFLSSQHDQITVMYTDNRSHHRRQPGHHHHHQQQQYTEEV